MTDFLFAIGFAVDDQLDTSSLEKGPDCIGIVAFIGEEFFDAGDQAEAVFDGDTIGAIAAREAEYPGPTRLLNYRMYLAVSAAVREPDRLKISPPFPPSAQRWTFTWLESNEACSGGLERAATHSNIFCQTPLSRHRAKRL